MTVVEEVVPVRVRVPRYFQYKCTECGKNNNIDRALFIVCPLCSAGPGAPCVDMRSKAKGKITPLMKIHTQRVSALTAT